MCIRVCTCVHESVCMCVCAQVFVCAREFRLGYLQLDHQLLLARRHVRHRGSNGLLARRQLGVKLQVVGKYTKYSSCVRIRRNKSDIRRKVGKDSVLGIKLE